MNATQHPTSTQVVPPLLLRSWPLRVLSAIIYVTLLLSVLVEYAYCQDNVALYAAAGFLCAAAVIFAVYPRAGAIALFSAWTLSFFLPLTPPIGYLSLGAIPLVFLGFASWPLGIASSMIASGFIAFLPASSLFGLPRNNLRLFLILAAVSLLCTALGRIVFLLRCRQEECRELEDRRQRERIALELHDVVCNDLCYALRLLDVSGQFTETDKRRLEDSLQNALQATRHSVNILHGAETAVCEKTFRTEQNDETVVLDIAEILRKGQSRLEQLGISGVLVIEPDDLRKVSAAQTHVSAITGFIAELFGNILKHADPDHPYTLTAALQGASLVIAASDVPSPTASGSTGIGLETYAAIIQRIGGALSVSQEENLWAMEAEIPLGAI